MPWKGSKDPYEIWLSEIILQQTRVEQGLPYFLKFKEHYPDVSALAAASEDDVLKLWQGLGYYSRARNLLFTARHIKNHLDGIFPDNYKELLKLKGVGPYTAAAIVSFAYNEPKAVVDGNVYRVLSRFFNIKTPVDSTAGKKIFGKLADSLIDKIEPGIYNQAIMDFGASVCTPANPNCNQCALAGNCAAYNQNMVQELPVKSKKLIKRVRHFNYIINQDQEKIFIRKRSEKDIWKNLYDFPLIETEIEADWTMLQNNNAFKNIFSKKEVEAKLSDGNYRQILTHQIIEAKFWQVNDYVEIKGDYLKVDLETLHNFAVPKIIDCYLKDKALYLTQTQYQKTPFMVNKVILVGRLGKDPEVRNLENNVVVANFPMATDEFYYDKNGEKVTKTEWHNISVWRRQAEVAQKYLVKGSLIYLEGKIRTRSYEDKDGVKKYITEIVADSFSMLDKKKDDAGSSGGSNNYGTSEVNAGGNNFNTEAEPSDDLPF